MFTDNDIEYIVRNSDFVAIATSDGISLKRNGKRWLGLCPFHDEKTPSFNIFSDTNTYKCFGCGVHGDVISYMQKKHNMDFSEAVRWLAERLNYELEETKLAPEVAEKEKEHRTMRQQLLELNRAAADFFAESLEKAENKEVARAMDYATRRWDLDTIAHFRIGYAPNDWISLRQYLTSKGATSDLLSHSTLFQKSDKSDAPVPAFKGRLMFPIEDHLGRIVGFTGRAIPGINPDFQTPKYKNTAEDDDFHLYQKGKVLYGLSEAAGAIQAKDEVIIVEGNPDVVRMHSIGVENVVAACGTALTADQMRLIARYTRNICLMYDGDEAGIEHLEKNGKDVISNELNCNIIEIGWRRIARKDKDGAPVLDENGHQAVELVKQDPDTAFSSKEDFEKIYNEKHIDYPTYITLKYRAECEVSPIRKAEVMQQVAESLAYMDEAKQNIYIEGLSKLMKPKAAWNGALKTALNEKRKDKQPAVAADNQQEEDDLQENGRTEEENICVRKYGFFIRRGSYWVANGEGQVGHEISNFTMKPLFHLKFSRGRKYGKRLFEITNKFGYSSFVELKQEEMSSLVSFCTSVENLGNYIFYGGQSDMNKVKNYLYGEVRECEEIEQMGWKKSDADNGDGFFAWANGITTEDGFTKYDEMGMAKYKSKWYYMPALSAFYKEDPEVYVQERKMQYMPTSASMYTLAEKMQVVYGDNAIPGLCFYLATCFKDIVISSPRRLRLPILNIFGPKGTGKSTMAVTLLQLFGNFKEGPSMGNSTIPALGEHVSMWNNALCHIDEYKNDDKSKDKVEFLKNLWDNSGRVKMDIDKGQKVETRVSCGVILTGQEMTTLDSALFSRVLFLSCSKTTFDDSAKEAFRDLQAYQTAGLTVITGEVMRLRKIVKEHYEENYTSALQELKAACGGKPLQDRILQNWLVPLAMLRTLRDHIQLPFAYNDALRVFAVGVQNQNSKVKDTQEVAEFWRTINAMIANNELSEDVDYKIEMVRKPEGQKIGTHLVAYGTEVFYLNPARWFELYKQHVNRSKDGTTHVVAADTLRDYLVTSETKEYIDVHMKWFDSTVKNLENPGDATLRTNITLNDPTSGVTAKRGNSQRALCFDYGKIATNYDVNFKHAYFVDDNNIDENA
jgi:DNA primase catalytic core